MRYWKLKNNTAVESHADHVDLSSSANEISRAEYDIFIQNMVAGPVQETDVQKLINYAKIQKWI